MIVETNTPVSNLHLCLIKSLSLSTCICPSPTDVSVGLSAGVYSGVEGVCVGVTVMKTGDSVVGLQYILTVTPSAGTAGTQ